MQQLRTAYQALVRQHEGNERRVQEIKDAYDAILLFRGGGNNEAIALLECVPEDQRGSEWHYRMGCVQRERGWLEEAEARFRHAALFNPENRKYRAALKRAHGDRFGKSDKSSFRDGAADTCVNECCCWQLCCEGCCEVVCDIF